MILTLVSITLFASAFLLFEMQPLIAKMILPRLGGSPSVWNTCNLFFQSVLLLGYGYAHWLAKWRREAKAQFWIHATLLLLPLAFLPLSIPKNWSPDVHSAFPYFSLLKVLFERVGIPFFVISTTAPLLQNWFYQTQLDRGKDPYFLYAASNIGSLSGLLAFPFVLEPLLTHQQQSLAWSGGFAVFLVLMLVVMSLMLTRVIPRLDRGIQRVSAENRTDPSFGGDSGFRRNDNDVSSPARDNGLLLGALRLSRKLRWMMLAFIPSSLYLAVTTHITSDIAAVPLLWVIPLSLYLVTFILAFAQKKIFSLKALTFIYPFFVLPLAINTGFNLVNNVTILIFWNLFSLFVLALLCHLQLSGDRPAPVHLTEFYLWISLGGVLGGAFNAILAPVFFRFNVEYPMTLALLCFFCPDRDTSAPKMKYLGLRLAIIAFLFFLPAGLTRLFPILMEGKTAKIALVLSVMIASLVCFSLRKKAKAFAVGVAVILLAGSVVSQQSFMAVGGKLLFRDRSFFGFHRITEKINRDTGIYHVYHHGTTIHGAQSREPARQCQALTYFNPSGPMGEFFGAFNRLHPAAEVAIVGLGSGSLVTYAQPNQRWTLFEIDPLVKRIAENNRYFTFLSSCISSYQMILGDARLSLQRVSDSQYDLIFLDAFSSDSVPIHLLTVEALELYRSKLKTGGVLVFNISNRYLDFEPLFYSLAGKLKLQALMRYDLFQDKQKDFDPTRLASAWVVLAESDADFGGLASNKNWRRLEPKRRMRAWSDDYSNIVSLLKRKV